MSQEDRGWVLNSSVLVLNRHYMALRVITARRAFILLYREAAEVIDIEDVDARTVHICAKIGCMKVALNPNTACLCIIISGQRLLDNVLLIGRPSACRLNAIMTHAAFLLVSWHADKEEGGTWKGSSKRSRTYIYNLLCMFVCVGCVRLRFGLLDVRLVG